jgi:hypothetical protein
MTYQFGWMALFFLEFCRKENGEQGYYPWDKKDGHWLCISSIGSKRLLMGSVAGIIKQTIRETGTFSYH